MQSNTSIMSKTTSELKNKDPNKVIYFIYQEILNFPISWQWNIW